MPGSAQIRRRSQAPTTLILRGASVSDVLARFSDALSLLAVAHHSLSAKELPGTGDEEVAIRHALAALRDVYSDLDRITSPTSHD